MGDQQMEVPTTTTLPELQQTHAELEAEQLEAGTASLGGVPGPALLMDPTPQAHMSIEKARVAGGRAANDEGSGPSREVPDPAEQGQDRQAGGLAAGDAGCGPSREVSDPAGKLRGLARSSRDVLKNIIITMHPTLFKKDCLKGLAKAAASAGVRLLPDETLPHSLVAFYRQRDVTTPLATDQWVEVPGWTACRHHLSVLCRLQLVQLVRQRRLCAHAGDMLRARPGRLTILVHDVLDTLSKRRLQILEEAKVELHLTLGVDLLILRKPRDLVAHLLYAACALAEQPYEEVRRRAEEKEAWQYLLGDNQHAVDVDEEGNGMNELWQQMLNVLPNSSAQQSRALAAQHPTARHVSEAVQSAEGAAALAVSPGPGGDGPAPRGEGPAPPGAAVAGTLRDLFTRDGDFVLE